jgi:hypothetical protein
MNKSASDPKRMVVSQIFSYSFQSQESSMNVDRLNQWLTLGANFGVVFGLVLVAFQFQQNTDAIRLQARIGASASIQNAELSIAGDTLAEAWTKSILTPSELTPSEIVQVWS